MTGTYTMEIEGAGINIGKFLICGGRKSVNIACVYKYTKKWDFIVDIDFLCEIENGIILKVTCIMSISIQLCVYIILLCYKKKKKILWKTL